MNAQNAFSLVAVFYSVANLGSMGLELNLRETIKSLRSVRVLGLTLGWSWLVGPAFAVLLTKILPMAEPYATGLLIFSLAPTAPALPLFIRRARADMSLAAAIMPLAVVSTVVLMPLMAPCADPGADVEQLGDRETAPADRAAAAGDRRGHQGLRRRGWRTGSSRR